MKSVQTGKDGNVTRCDARGRYASTDTGGFTRRRSTKSSDFTQAQRSKTINTAEHKPEPFGQNKPHKYSL